MPNITRRLLTYSCLLSVFSASVLRSDKAQAQATADEGVAQFYQGKAINLLVGVGPGGDYDLKMRLVARFLSKHIPGNPAVIPQNMLGATGLTMANYLYRIAPRDGTYIGLIQNGLPAYQAVGMPGAQFEPTGFNWLGSLSPGVETMAVWKTAGVRSIADARTKEVVIGAVGSTGISSAFPKMLNELLGTRFKVVGGYPGAGNVNLAMERGEVMGRANDWSSFKTNNEQWLKNGDLVIILYSGRKLADLQGVECLEDMLTKQEDRQLVEAITSGLRFGLPFATTPAVPLPRLAALRKAFVDMMQDSQFLAAAAELRTEIEAISAEELTETAESLRKIPEAVKARARRLLEG